MIIQLYIYIYISNIQLVTCIIACITTCIMCIINPCGIIAGLYRLYIPLYNRLHAYAAVNQLVVFDFGIMYNDIGKGGVIERTN